MYRPIAYPVCSHTLTIPYDHFPVPASRGISQAHMSTTRSWDSFLTVPASCLYSVRLHLYSLSYSTSTSTTHPDRYRLPDTQVALVSTLTVRTGMTLILRGIISTCGTSHFASPPITGAQSRIHGDSHNERTCIWDTTYGVYHSMFHVKHPHSMSVPVPHTGHSTIQVCSNTG